MFAGSNPRCSPRHYLSSHSVAGVPHIKWRKMSAAQGQSSSAKRGLAADVSSGLVFLKKKKRKKKRDENVAQRDPVGFYDLSKVSQLVSCPLN